MPRADGLRKDGATGRWIDTRTPEPVVYVRTGKQSGWSPRPTWRAECGEHSIAHGYNLADTVRDARAAFGKTN